MIVLYIDGVRIGDDELVKPLIDQFIQYAQADPFGVVTFINLDDTEPSEAAQSKVD